MLADDPHLLLRDRRAFEPRRARRPAAACRRTIIDDGARRRDGHSTWSASTPADRCIAASPIRRASATGTKRRRFNLQWSLYHRADKAVKSGLSRLRLGRWRVRARRWTTRASSSRYIARPPRSLAPGQVPRLSHAVGDGGDRGRCCAGADSRRARSRRSRAPLRGCRNGDEALDPRCDDRRGRRPRASRRRSRAKGSRARRSVPLIEAGGSSARWSSRAPRANSGSTANGANGAETPESLDDGGRRRCRRPTRWPRSTPASSSAISGTSTTRTGPRAA